MDNCPTHSINLSKSPPISNQTCEPCRLWFCEQLCPTGAIEVNWEPLIKREDFYKAIFSWIAAIEDIPARLAGSLLGMTQNPIMLLLLFLAPACQSPGDGQLTVVYPLETTELAGGQLLRVTVTLADHPQGPEGDGQPLEGATVQA